jgi:hypothetical protein
MLRKFQSAAAALLAVLVPTLAVAGPLWFGDQAGIHQIDTASNQVQLNIAQEQSYALALNQKDGSVWSLTASRLVKYGPGGALLLQRDLRSYAQNLGAGRFLALDPSDDSVWLAGDGVVAHVDAAGNTLPGFAVSNTIQDIALAQDQSLWVLTQKQLLHFTAQSTSIVAVDLPAQAQQSKYMALDEAAGILWIAGAKQAWRVQLAAPQQAPAATAIPEVIAGISLAPDSSTLWIAGQSTLFAYGKDGQLTGQNSLNTANNPVVIAYDSASQSIWLGHGKGLSRFTATGQYVLTLPAASMANAISRSPAGIVPRLILIQPPDNALTTDPLPTVRYQFDAICFGQPCGYPPAKFADYRLTSLLNGQSIGSNFVFDPATAQSSFTPVNRLPEGKNTLSSYVTDGSGRRSSTVDSSFTIDSIAPAFQNVAPPDRSVFVSPNITIQGSLDDPQGVVLLQGQTAAKQNFSFPVVLSPGSNTFNLSAVDLAGNTRSLQLVYIYNTLTLALTGPQSGAVIDDNKVTVTGTFSGDANPTITVNGVVATLNGNSFTAVVPLAAGLNTLTVKGTTTSGAVATQTLTVTSTFPGVTIASPTNGATINGGFAFVSGTVQAPAGSGVNVNGVVAAVDAASHFYANNVPLQPGTNTLTATVTTRSGKSSTSSVNVTSSGNSPVFFSIDPADGLAPLTVGFRATSNTGRAIVSYQLNPGGPGTAAANSDPSVLTKFTYTQAGIYVATLTVTDSGGNAYSQQFAISVQDLQQMDQMFKSLWNGMNNAVIAGDKPTALSYLSSSAQAKYGPVFDALKSSYQDIVSTWSAPMRGDIAGSIAEYSVVTPKGTGRQVFLIYFIKGTDGVWRLDSM